jgi:single-stranded-DNA-specific exonuclease
MSDRFAQALKHFCEKLRKVVEEGNEVAIISHLDADGIASASIMAMALRRMGARYSVRTVSGMNESVLETMKADGRDFYMITDLGGGWISALRKTIGDKWQIIDHHQVTKVESSKEEAQKDDSQILNPWEFGIDGGREISAGGMAYLVASTLDSKNHDLSAIAVVSAVADKQDHGEKKSFVGLNAEILKTAQSLGIISVDLDILLNDRETSPVHEALAYSLFHYIDGLTWNREGCYLLLKNAGIKLRDDNGRWRVLTDFSQEEKTTIVEVIARFAATSDKRLYDIMLDNLFGYVYTLTKEDKRSQLRDAREFSTLLNACGRKGSSGVAIAICMGDRSTALNNGEEIMSTYKMTLRSNIHTILNEKWRLSDDGKTIFINGDGVLEEDMVGAVSNLLSKSPSLRGRLLFVRTLTDNDSYKFSSRKGIDCQSHANLGILMEECAHTLNGVGGGHSEAAGCTIPSHTLDRFIACIKAKTNDSEVTNT